jgi:preprotein translocase subunit SecG
VGSRAASSNSFGGDFGDLFGRRADDVFLVKMSYWLNW